MQETQFQTRLAQEDKRWMIGDADLGSVLAPFYAELAAPVSLESVAQGSPQSQLTSALVSVSVDINTLTQEQVRLRETLETLNSTLFITDKSLTTTTADGSAGAQADAQKKPVAATRSWGEKSLEVGADAAKFVGKEVLTGLWDKAKDRLSGKAIDAVADRFPTAAKWLKDDKGNEAKKGKDCCCPAAVEIPRGRDRFGPGGGDGKKSSNTPKSPSAPTRSQGPAKKTARLAGLARLFGWAAKPSGGASVGFNVGAPAQGLQPHAALLNSRSLSALSRGPGLIEALERGLVPMPSEGQSNSPSRIQPASHERLPAAPPIAFKMLPAGLAGAMSKLESSAARRLGPLKYVDTAMDVVQGVRNGDAKAVGAGLTTAGGAWAGASAGAAIGTLVFPGVGTAVGGAIGGLLGSEAGAWLGEKLFSSSDRLPAPAAVSKELNAARTDNVQVTIAPSIQITGVNPADAQQVVNQVIQALQFQCMPMVTDSLGIRRNAALADPPGGD